VNVLASVSRMLQDGGSEPILDAGVALNGEPLGEGDLEDRGPNLPLQASWTRPAFAGVGFGLPQRLSVIGANAQALFACPVEVRFTSPDDGASLARGVPIDFQWTPGGSKDYSQVLTIEFLSKDFSYFRAGLALLDPGLTAYSFQVPPDLPAQDLDGYFDLFVPGDADPDTPSGCQVDVRRRLHFPFARAR